MGHVANASRTICLCISEGKYPASYSGRFTHKYSYWVKTRSSFRTQILYRWFHSGSWTRRSV